MRKTTKYFTRPGFTCRSCRRWVPINKLMATRHRNHCPFCLHSRHVQIPCHGLMTPIALTFKKEGQDKYGQPRQGEIMLVHQCQKCGDFSLNRLAADDDPETVLRIFENSLVHLPVVDPHIVPLVEKDRSEIRTQLFGKASLGG